MPQVFIFTRKILSVLPQINEKDQLKEFQKIRYKRMYVQVFS